MEDGSKGYQKIMDSKKVVCFDIGGTNVKYGLLDFDGNILHKGMFKSDIKNGQYILHNMANVVDSYKEQNNIVGISISTPGFVDVKSGVILDGTIIEGFIGLNIKSYFENIYNLEVAVDNDANCATIGEHRMGNGNNCRNMICLTIGTGIGGGIIINNEIYHGSKFMAGEFGFMFINGIGEKHPEEYIYSNYASTRALIEDASNKLNRQIDGKEIFSKAQDGDLICQGCINDFYDNLAKGIYNLGYILNPEKILIGGAISQQEDIIDEIKTRLDKYTPSFSKSLNEYIELDRCKFLNDSGLIGSLCNFINKYEIN